MTKPYVHQPQVGPGHKKVTITHQGKSITIKCRNNEAAIELAKNLIYTFTRNHIDQIEKTPP